MGRAARLVNLARTLSSKSPLDIEACSL